MKSSLKFFLLVLTVMVVACKEKSNSTNPLLGSWSIEKIQWISEDTTLSRVPVQKGLLLVTPDCYSICWSPMEQTRVPFENLSNPTKEEMIRGFSTIVFNTGGYTVSKDYFTTKAHLAKVPGFEGGMQYYSYHIQGTQMTLTLFDETYPNGEKPNWFGKWRTKYSLNRLTESKTN
nr:hypothetical protein [uncultured Allomuricauda sp.]